MLELDIVLHPVLTALRADRRSSARRYPTKLTPHIGTIDKLNIEIVSISAFRLKRGIYR